ncbi:hypothetical protein ACFW4L_11410 [Streptomyces sp. NPDC058832]|uniref:hypothetical protein n=1 Tax=Streptomyces sp. NPDC058832 TaxID=3346646 RepID=UPI0036820CAC
MDTTSTGVTPVAASRRSGSTSRSYPAPVTSPSRFIRYRSSENGVFMAMSVSSASKNATTGREWPVVRGGRGGDVVKTGS